MISVKKNGDDTFNVLIVVCYDNKHGKYRSVNLSGRAIAAQLYDSPDDLVKDLQDLKDAGRIKDFEIVERGKK